jgi:hypothetical protein
MERRTSTLLGRAELEWTALWDAAFDCGLVSFADNGSVLASSQLSETSRRALDLDNISPLTGVRDAHRANLALYRARNGF